MKLKEFIDKYSDGIASVIEERLNPVHNPLKPEGVEKYEALMLKLLRQPFPVQGELAKAISKALYEKGREKLFVVGEMGCGKTLIALSSIFMSPKPMRTLVVCPTHLVEKWIREVNLTIPDAKTIDLCVKGVISILEKMRYEKRKPQRHEIYVISKERLKLSYAWRAAAVKRKVSKFPHCPRCGEVAETPKSDNYITFENLEKKRYTCIRCKEPLWQADRKLRRYAAADFIKKYLKGFFDLCILDEVQDYKAGESLQGLSMGAVTSVIDKCLCLTGTLNSGYADDLFYLLYRTSARDLRESGFDYRNSQKWLESFGTVERVQKIDEKDNYYGRGKKKGEIVRKRPGVSPAVVGKYLLDKSVFIRLADVIEGLPPYEENVISIRGDDVQMRNYAALEEKLKGAVKAYRTKALAAMLQALLSYPDSCVAYPENIEIKDRTTGRILQTIKAPKLDDSELLPKEKELIDLVGNEKAGGRKVLCYLTFTDSRDIRPRLKSVLEKSGYRVGVLDASVEPKKREAWVRNNTSGIDVLLVNAELVKTGLDLYEFPTVVFYQIGYNIFTLRQAARRSWRIGQTQPVKVYFFCYQDTIQALALSLIAKKLEIALLVEGDLPEGLAEYGADDTSIASEIIKSLMEGTNTTNAEKAWANFRKKEVESQLGLCRDETIFTEIAKGKPKKTQTDNKSTIADDVFVRVSIIETNKKKQSTLEIKHGAIDALLTGKTVQFCMF